MGIRYFVFYCCWRCFVAWKMICTVFSFRNLCFCFAPSRRCCIHVCDIIYNFIHSNVFSMGSWTLIGVVSYSCSWYLNNHLFAQCSFSGSWIFGFCIVWDVDCSWKRWWKSVVEFCIDNSGHAFVLVCNGFHSNIWPKVSLTLKGCVLSSSRCDIFLIMFYLLSHLPQHHDVWFWVL